jgi:hypothetical protein
MPITPTWQGSQSYQKKLFAKRNYCTVLLNQVKTTLLLPFSVNHSICILQDYIGGI